MKMFGTYLFIQLRRTVKLLPSLMILTALLCACAGIFALQHRNGGEDAQTKQKYQIAVVGDTGDSYLGFGISVLSVMDDSRFMVDFPVMTEDEARRALMAGQITAYARVPEGLTESIVRGSNDRPVTLVGSTAQKGIAGILVEELADVASTVILRSQSAIYAMQNILRDRAMGDRLQEETEKLNLRMIDMVLNRTGLCSLEILGTAGGLPAPGHYLCGAVIFFLLLSGICSSPLFGKKNTDLMRWMVSRGVGPVCQVAGEYLACFMLECCCLFGMIAALWPALGTDSLRAAGWEGLGLGKAAAFGISLIPVAAVLAAMQFLMYELVTGTVSSILLQFVCGISMAYISGCFYPAAMFPDVLRRIGEALPAGMALRYAEGSLKGDIPLQTGLGLMSCAAVFLVLSALARSRRIRRG